MKVIENIFNLKNISYFYNKISALNSIFFTVNKGEFVGIIGPNGAGKSTLLNILSQLLSPENGEASLYGRNLLDFTKKELSRLIAVVPAEMYIPYSFTVQEIVSMGRTPHMGLLSIAKPSDNKIINNAIDTTHIRHLINRNINSLSSGEKQRVFISQALAQQPHILLLDEPTSHLDIHHQIEILRILKKQNEETHLTVIMVSHDINLASEFCSKLVLMDSGRIVKTGEPKEIITAKHIREIYGLDIGVQINPYTNRPNLYLKN
ncbi:MAG: ABC transporter ATP-binding protein [bacterium]